MSDIIKLELETPLINAITGEPVHVISMEYTAKLGISTEFEMNQRIGEFPISTLGNIIITLFDATPITSMNLHSIYSEIAKKIRDAKQNNQKFIEVSKENLDQFKKIFTEKPPENPANNRNVAFVIECIELAIAKSIVKQDDN